MYIHAACQDLITPIFEEEGEAKASLWHGEALPAEGAPGWHSVFLESALLLQHGSPRPTPDQQTRTLATWIYLFLTAELT